MINVTEADCVKLQREDVKATTAFSSQAVDNTEQEKSVNIVPAESRHLSTYAETQKTIDSENSKGFVSKMVTNTENVNIKSDVEIENISSKECLLKKEKLPSVAVAIREMKEEKSSLKETPLVVENKVHKLKLPDNYNGSQMFMPTGERLFWLGETRPSASGPASYQDFKEIRSQCLADGKLFKDPEFPALDRSLYYEKRPDIRLTWRRPKRICKNPQLFVKSHSRFDVKQGILGDCWLLAAVANLTLHKKLFYQVVPNDQSFGEDYAGIFHFRIWQYGLWVDVVIDDRLPTNKGKLVYLRSSEGNEFWSALLEKAYAKLHGSYEALTGGLICEAMVDFTGGITESYKMTELPANFFTILLKAYERNSLLGCFIESDPNVTKALNGLVGNHAYSVTCVKYVDRRRRRLRRREIPLLRLRNPWGNEAEWKGAWSDKSPEWRFMLEAEKEELGLTFDDDGEFWMSYKDFFRHFARVEICHLNPDTFNLDECPEGCTKKWEMSVFEGEWVKDISAGGCPNHLDTFWKNPHYTVTLQDPDDDDEDNKCTIIVALMQKNRRSQRHRGLSCLIIGFKVYRLPDHEDVQNPLQCHSIDYTAPVGSSKAFTNEREVSARFKFEPGSYVIVPSTFEPNQEGEFLLRVFSEKSNDMAENDEEVFMCDVDDRIRETTPNPEPADQIRDLFNRLAGSDGEVDWQGLKEILDYAMKEELRSEGFSEDACKSMIVMLDEDNSGGLGFEEFKSLWIDLRQWRAVFRLYDSEGRGAVPQQHLRDALHSAGYTVNAHVLNVLAHRYSSSDGIQFDEFVTCVVRLKTMVGETKNRNI